jgi:hypothetical protein
MSEPFSFAQNLLAILPGIHARLAELDTWMAGEGVGIYKRVVLFIAREAWVPGVSVVDRSTLFQRACLEPYCFARGIIGTTSMSPGVVALLAQAHARIAGERICLHNSVDLVPTREALSRTLRLGAFHGWSFAALHPLDQFKLVPVGEPLIFILLVTVFLPVAPAGTAYAVIGIAW